MTITQKPKFGAKKWIKAREDAILTGIRERLAEEGCVAKAIDVKTIYNMAIDDAIAQLRYVSSTQVHQGITAVLNNAIEELVKVKIN